MSVVLDKIVLNRLVRRVVEHCTNLPSGAVRPSGQKASTSGETFATVLIMNVDGAGDSHTYEDLVGDEQQRVEETQNSHVRITASIQVFRKDAYLLANKLHDRITLTSALQLMRSLGLGFISCTSVKDLSKVVNENWEEKAAVDIDFYVVSTETDLLLTFGTFPITISTGTFQQSTEVNEP